MKWIAVFFMIITLIACTKRDESSIELSLKGEMPENGQVRVQVYGYDKMLADHKASLIVIHREDLTREQTVTLELPEDAKSYIEPPVKGENVGYYLRIEIEDGKNLYTQDFDKNGFIKIEEDSKIDVYMKKK